MPDPTPPNPDPSAAGGAPPAGAAPAGAPPAAWYGDADKSYVEGKGWDTPAKLLASYKSLETVYGADKAGRTIIRPKDDNDAEGIAAFRQALGVPKDLTGYKLPEAAKDDPSFKSFAEHALKVGMPAAQFEATMAWLDATQKQMDEKWKAEASKVSSEQLAKLRAEWGPESAKREEYAKRFALESGWSAEEWQKMEMAIGTARLLTQFYKHGSAMGEPKFVGGEGGAGGFNAQKAQIQKQIDQLMADRTNGSVSQQEYFGRIQQLHAQLAAA